MTEDRPWLVTYRGNKGGTLKRRFYTEWAALHFMETALSHLHPTQKTLTCTSAVAEKVAR